MGCFFLTTIGWFAWLSFLDGVYGPTPSGPYVIRDTFTGLFGRDASWWATMFGVLAMLGLFEMCFKTAKRNLQVVGLWKLRPWKNPGLAENVEDWDLELWQELEQNPVVRKQLKQMAREGQYDDDDDEDVDQEEEEICSSRKDVVVEPIVLGVDEVDDEVDEKEKNNASTVHIRSFVSRCRKMIPH